MDYQAIALVCAIIAVVATSLRLNLYAWGRPGWQYHRVFSAGFGGLFFLVAGLIGWTLSRHDAFVAGTKWQDGPIWWQVGVGVVMLALAAFWASRLPARSAAR